MFRGYFRRLCICVVLFTLLFLLTNDRTKKLSKTSHVTDNRTTVAVKRRPYGKFFVFSPQCKIPYIDPFAEELLQWEPMILESCPEKPNLFSVTYDRTRMRYRIHLNRTVAENHYASYSPFGCTYIGIIPGSDNVFVQAKPINFSPDWIVPGHLLGVIVECHALDNADRVMQRDAFSFVQHPGKRGKPASRKPNIFIFGIDSMSRINFRKTMPLTSKFVRQEGWFEMEGYHSVDDDKITNLLAILTDRTSAKGKPLCNSRNPTCLNMLTSLWKHFRNAGYLTAYAEDVTSDYFDHLGMGYIRMPVDFYFRPFLVVVERVFRTVKQFGLCLGRRHSVSYVFDFAKQLIKRYVLELPTPLFGVFWTSSFTHNDFRGGSALDELFVRYLQEFQEYGLFESSIVILVSDRGSRQGLLVNHPTGFLEERLPMLHIYLPPWYQRTYPSVVEAMQLNRNRLSSNCDLYLGFRQLVDQVRPGIWFTESTSTCHSIMKELPKDRSCTAAFIPAKWCACEPFLRVPTTYSTAQMAYTVVYRMNKYLRLKGSSTLCYRLVLSKVLKAELQLHYDKNGDRVPAPGGSDTIQLVFTVEKYGAMFLSKVQSKEGSNIVTIPLEKITRLGPYRNTSDCVADEMAKKFCICRKDD